MKLLALIAICVFTTGCGRKDTDTVHADGPPAVISPEQQSAGDRSPHKGFPAESVLGKGTLGSEGLRTAFEKATGMRMIETVEAIDGTYEVNPGESPGHVNKVSFIARYRLRMPAEDFAGLLKHSLESLHGGRQDFLLNRENGTQPAPADKEKRILAYIHIFAGFPEAYLADPTCTFGIDATSGVCTIKYYRGVNYD